MVQIPEWNPEEVPEDTRGDFEPLPAGYYAMQIIDSEVLHAKSGDGQMIKLTFEIIENIHPEYAGRQVWDYLNLWHTNQKTQEIARQSLKRLLTSIGVRSHTNTESWYHKPLAVRLKLRPGDDRYEPSNKISKYDPLGKRFPQHAAAGTPPQNTPAPQQAPQQTAPATPVAEPPWKR